MTMDIVVSLFFINIFTSLALCSSDCKKGVPLGMNSGSIKSSQITVSSAANFSFGGLARLNRNVGPRGAWCPKQKDGDASEIRFNEYIQIDLLRLRRIANIATQGREYKGGKEFTTKYKISYSDDNEKWVYFKEIANPKKPDRVFHGNSDVSGIVVGPIKPYIVARYIRIHPGYYLDQVCLRLEVYGCAIQDIISYSMPQGQNTTNGNVHYKDTNYTGVDEDGILRRGTGLLTDGIIGPADPKLYMGKRWVGWQSATKPQGINITFRFDGLRRFDNVTITMNINSARKNSLFNRSVIFVGKTEDQLSESSFLRYCSKQHEGENVSKNEDVTLSLCGNIAQFVKIQFYPGEKWLLISEIKFGSVPVQNTKNEGFKNCESKAFPCVGHHVTSSPGTKAPPVTTQSPWKKREWQDSFQKHRVVIPLVCLFFLIVAIILGLLWRRRRSRHPTTTENVALEIEPACHVMKSGNDQATSEKSKKQTSKKESFQESSHEIPADGDYEYPSASADVDATYAALNRATDTDEHVYQARIVDSAQVNSARESGYVTPFDGGYEYPSASVAVDSTYTALEKTTDADQHVYQKFLKN